MPRRGWDSNTSCHTVLSGLRLEVHEALENALLKPKIRIVLGFCLSDFQEAQHLLIATGSYTHCWACSLSAHCYSEFEKTFLCLCHESFPWDQATPG